MVNRRSPNIFQSRATLLLRWAQVAFPCSVWNYIFQLLAVTSLSFRSHKELRKSCEKVIVLNYHDSKRYVRSRKEKMRCREDAVQEWLLKGALPSPPGYSWKEKTRCREDAVQEWLLKGALPSPPIIIIIIVIIIIIIIIIIITYISIPVKGNLRAMHGPCLIYGIVVGMISDPLHGGRDSVANSRHCGQCRSVVGIVLVRSSA